MFLNGFINDITQNKYEDTNRLNQLVTHFYKKQNWLVNGQFCFEILIVSCRANYLVNCDFQTLNNWRFSSSFLNVSLVANANAELIMWQKAVSAGGFAL